jgi:hypothetical protein
MEVLSFGRLHVGFNALNVEWLWVFDNSAKIQMKPLFNITSLCNVFQNGRPLSA